jgi:putative hemolysin
VGLVVLNGLFSMSELAIVSARPARLKVAAEAGSRGARTALELAADPGKFLSTVQIGITLVGIVAGAYSGASLGGPVGERLAAAGVPALCRRGGLHPGHRGHHLPQPRRRGTGAQAAGAARGGTDRHRRRAPDGADRPHQRAVRVGAGPLVRLLLRLLRLNRDRAGSHREELQMIFAEATRSGVIEEDERALMTSVMRLAERPVREVMTPRTELHWIERKASEAEIRAAIEDSPHSLLLVADGSVDRIVGVAKVRDVLSVLLRGRKIMLTRLMKKPAIVPDQLDTMDALRVIQQAEVALALVHDEYGHLEGIVTPADLLAAIAGNFVGHGDEGDAPMIVEREDGSLLIAGALPADALGDRLAIDLPEDRDYATAAGLCCRC